MGSRSRAEPMVSQQYDADRTNINANTEGYTRQRLVIESLY